MGMGWPGSGSSSGTFPPTAPVIVPAWFRIGTFTHEDFQTDNTVFALNPYDLPIKCVVHGLILTPVTQFDGVAITSYTLEIGTTTDPERFAGPFEMLDVDPGTGVVFQTAALLDQADHVNPVDMFITARSVGAGLDASTAGEFYLDMLLSVTP